MNKNNFDLKKLKKKFFFFEKLKTAFPKNIEQK